jgi:hypothetical protein
LNPTNRPTRAGSSNSSPGVFQRRPSIGILAARPLLDGKPPFGSKMPASSSFRPCRSSRLRRLPPRDPRRFVAPCTRSWGSVRFGSTTLSTPCGASNHVSLPRNRVSHPSEPSPRRQPYRVTAALAPAPFPVVHAPKCEAPFRPRGLAPPTSPVSRPGVAAATDPLLSWASFPFRVLPEFSASRVPKDWRPDLP